MAPPVVIDLFSGWFRQYGPTGRKLAKACPCSQSDVLLASFCLRNKDDLCTVSPLRTRMVRTRD